MAYGAGRHQLPAPEEPPPPSYQSLYGSAPPYSHRIFINQLTCEVAPSVSEALSDHEPPDSAVSCAAPVGGDLGVGTLPLHGVEADGEGTPESRGGVHPSAPEPSDHVLGGATPISDDEEHSRPLHWAEVDRPMTHKSWGGSAPTTPEPRETPSDDLEVLILPVGGISASDRPVAHESVDGAAFSMPVPGDLSGSGSAEDGSHGAHTQPLLRSLADRQVTYMNGGEGAPRAPETLDHVRSSAAASDGRGPQAPLPERAVANRLAPTRTDEGGLQPLQPSGRSQERSEVVPSSYMQREHIEPVRHDVSQQRTVNAQTAIGGHPTYIACSIFTCLFCCLPIGLIALYFSRRSANATNETDAKENSLKAKKANMAAMTLGIFLALVGGFCYFFLSNSNTYATAKPQTTAAAYYNYRYNYNYNTYYDYYYSYYYSYNSYSYGYYYYYSGRR